jgi:hypothetical protein
MIKPALAGNAFGMGVAVPLAHAISPGATAISQPATIVRKAFGCHRSCERGPVPRWGDVVRWHRHAGPGCAPVACYPRAAYPNRCWVDGFGVRHCRW